MDIFNIQSLIKQGRLVKATDIDPNQTYLQIGVYQKGNRENNASNANTYESYAIELSEISGGSGLIIVTKAELDVLINTNTLVAGAFYKVLGVDTPLYGGTDIIVQAVSTNKISEDGVGFFYNPDYSQYSIYNPYTQVNISTVSGEFEFNEGVITDLGDKGDIKGNLIPSYPGYLDYPYPSAINIATTVTGLSSGAVANISILLPPDFALGTKVIWGGRVWVNISDTRGSIIDLYTLSSDAWEPIPYNDTDYNYVMDPIKYDYDNDFLSYRAEVDADNTVLATAIDTYAIQSQIGATYFVNAIKAFQWGRQYDFNTNIGNALNHVENSYFECINFKTQNTTGNNFSQTSIVYDVNTIALNSWDSNTFSQQTIANSILLIDSSVRLNSFDGGSNLNNLILQSSVIDANSGFNVDIYSLEFYIGSLSSNHLNDSFLGNLNFINGSLYNNDLTQGSFISNINLRDSSLIAWNVLTSQSSINFDILNLNAQLTYNTLSNNSSIPNNTISNSNVARNVLRSNGTIASNVFNNSSSITNNILTISSIYNNLLDATQMSYNILDINSNIGYNSFVSTSLVSNKLSILSSIGSNNLINGRVNQNTLINGSLITNCVLSDLSEINYNLIENNSIIRVYGGINTQVNNNTVSNFSLIEEVVNTVQTPIIIYNVIDKQSKINQNNWFSTGSITNNNLSNSEISSNNIDTGTINYCSLLNNSFITGNDIRNNSSIERCSLDLSTINACVMGINNYMSNYILQNSIIANWGIGLVTGVTSPKTTFINITVSGLSTFPSIGIFQGMTEYADNAAALAGGLQVGQLYRITGTGSVQIVI